MRPILCKGGFPLPVKEGMCEIVGVCAPVNSVSTAARLTLQDNNPYADGVDPFPTESADLKNIIFDYKAMANVDNNIAQMFKEPIKAINGVCLVNASNLLPGRIIVYVK
jgi:hypothetical protein